MDMEREKSELELEHVQADGQGDHGNTSVLNSESDLADHTAFDEAHDEDEQEAVDLAAFSKQQLAAYLKELLKEDTIRKIERTLREARPLVDEWHERDKTAALNRFILDGGQPTDFEYRGDETDQLLESLLKQLRDRRTQFVRGQEDRKNENLRKKQELLEKLRVLIDANDGTDQFEQFKALQREWKNTGAVPGSQATSIWANYHALIDRFYDNQSIYFELKELDRKRNLVYKQELCVRAEKLVSVEKIKDAIRELNELHHEFKHIGPVPKDDKEQVWQRFKAASDAVYARRDEFLKGLQQELQANLAQKHVLADEVQAFASFTSDRIKEWNQKTKEILEIQKKWELVGGLPRNKARDVNKKFWSAFKGFFSNKNAFFKKLDDERDHNLKKKEELVKKALDLKESADWDKTSNELKNLQSQWKDIGPVPEKFREKIFKEFKEACDYFFEQKRGQHNKQEQEQLENLKEKESICAAMETALAQGTATADQFHELIGRFGAIGFVPRKDMNTIRNRYHEAMEKYAAAIPGLKDDERASLLLESQIQDLRNDPMGDRKLFQKEQTIRKKISKVENDIAVLRNNMEFFARSKNADQVRLDFTNKIEAASDELKQLKQQLKLLRTVS